MATCLAQLPPDVFAPIIDCLDTGEVANLFATFDRRLTRLLTFPRVIRHVQVHKGLNWSLKYMLSFFSRLESLTIGPFDGRECPFSLFTSLMRIRVENLHIDDAIDTGEMEEPVIATPGVDGLISVATLWPDLKSLEWTDCLDTYLGVSAISSFFASFPRNLHTLAVRFDVNPIAMGKLWHDLEMPHLRSLSLQCRDSYSSPGKVDARVAAKAANLVRYNFPELETLQISMSLIFGCFSNKALLKQIDSLFGETVEFPASLTDLTVDSVDKEFMPPSPPRNLARFTLRYHEDHLVYLGDKSSEAWIVFLLTLPHHSFHTLTLLPVCIKATSSNDLSLPLPPSLTKLKLEVTWNMSLLYAALPPNLLDLEFVLIEDRDNRRSINNFLGLLPKSLTRLIAPDFFVQPKDIPGKHRSVCGWLPENLVDICLRFENSHELLLVHKRYPKARITTKYAVPWVSQLLDDDDAVFNGHTLPAWFQKRYPQLRNICIAPTTEEKAWKMGTKRLAYPDDPALTFSGSSLPRHLHTFDLSSGFFVYMTSRGMAAHGKRTNKHRTADVIPTRLEPDRSLHISSSFDEDTALLSRINMDECPTSRLDTEHLSILLEAENANFLCFRFPRTLTDLNFADYDLSRSISYSYKSREPLRLPDNVRFLRSQAAFSPPVLFSLSSVIEVLDVPMWHVNSEFLLNLPPSVQELRCTLTKPLVTDKTLETFLDSCFKPPRVHFIDGIISVTGYLEEYRPDDAHSVTYTILIETALSVLKDFCNGHFAIGRVKAEEYKHLSLAAKLKLPPRVVNTSFVLGWQNQALLDSLNPNIVPREHIRRLELHISFDPPYYSQWQVTIADLCRSPFFQLALFHVDEPIQRNRWPTTCRHFEFYLLPPKIFQIARSYENTASLPLRKHVALKQLYLNEWEGVCTLAAPRHPLSPSSLNKDCDLGSLTRLEFAGNGWTDETLKKLLDLAPNITRLRLHDQATLTGAFLPPSIQSFSFSTLCDLTEKAIWGLKVPSRIADSWLILPETLALHFTMRPSSVVLEPPAATPVRSMDHYYDGDSPRYTDRRPNTLVTEMVNRLIPRYALNLTHLDLTFPSFMSYASFEALTTSLSLVKLQSLIIRSTVLLSTASSTSGAISDVFAPTAASAVSRFVKASSFSFGSALPRSLRLLSLPKATGQLRLEHLPPQLQFLLLNSATISEFDVFSLPTSLLRIKMATCWSDTTIRALREYRPSLLVSPISESSLEVQKVC